MSTLKRKIFFALFGILFGLSIGFLFAEILFRLAAPEWLIKEMNEANLSPFVAGFGSDVGWKVETIDSKFVRFVPNTKFDVHYYEYNHSVHIDNLGGRTVSGSDTKQNAEIVPFLGDSFEFGLGVEDNQTYTSLLNQHSPYRFIDLGVPGSALPNHLDQIEFRHKELHSPRVYVFSFFTGNDYSEIVKYYGKMNMGTEEEQKKPGGFIRWLDRNIYHNRLLGRSYFLQYIKHTLLRDYFFTDQRVRSVLPSSCGKVTKGQTRLTNSALIMMAAKKKCLTEIDSQVKIALDHLEELSRRLKFSAVFIIIPDKLQVNRSLLESKAAAWDLDPGTLDTNGPSKLIEKELAARNIPYFDVADCLRAKDGMYYKIDDHFTPAGHKALAECLSGKLDATISASLH